MYEYYSRMFRMGKLRGSLLSGEKYENVIFNQTRRGVQQLFILYVARNATAWRASYSYQAQLMCLPVQALSDVHNMSVCEGLSCRGTMFSLCFHHKARGESGIRASICPLKLVRVTLRNHCYCMSNCKTDHLFLTHIHVATATVYFCSHEEC